MATDNLNLNTYTFGVDPDIGFEQYRLLLDGPTDSNMTLIDAWAGTIPILLSAMSTNSSGSIATFNTFISNASGSIVTAGSNINTVDARFDKIDEFDGAGLANFTSIPQTYTHLLIVGSGAVDYATNLVEVGIDFNGDTDVSHYVASEWENSGSAVPYVETFTSQTTSGQVLIGTVPGSSVANYAGTFMALVPNYSVNGGLYKIGMGFSIASIITWIAAGIQSGVWLSTVPITRIQVFGSEGFARYNFLAGTKVSLYGIL